MSRVIYWMMVSLDGFVARPNGDIDWINVDEEQHSFANDEMRAMGTILYGRRMYELMAAYWPTADLDPSASAVEIEFARIWKPKPKVVFSRTLERVDWNARLVRDDIAGEVARLKAQPNNDIGLGGATLAASFMRLGLIDEYCLLVQPIVLGRGIPFFSPSDTPIRLRLVETHTFKSGVVYLRYQHADEAPERGR